MRTLKFKSHLHNCPFRGCAGNWVKLGVAKRHGVVLGDAVSKMADENTKVQGCLENDDLENEDLENNDLENDDSDGVARRIRGLEGYRGREIRGR